MSMTDLNEGFNIQPGFLPADTDTDQAGDYISLKDYNKVVVVYAKGAGTAGDDPTLTLYEATAVDGTDAQVLAVIDKHYIKQAATNLTAVGEFTKTAQTAASTIVFNATSAEQTVLDYFVVDAAQLSNGFDCIRVDCALAASGGAQYATLLYFLLEPRYGQEPAVSAITD
jgi:hypothetical protein